MARPKLSAHTLEQIFDLLAMVAVASVCLPFANLLTAYYPHTNAFLRCLLLFLCFAAGWGLQHLICVLTRHRRAVQRGGYEKSQKYYHIGLTLPIWGLAAAIFLLLPGVIDAHLQYIAEIDSQYYYDSHSAFPMLVANIVSVLFVLGSATRLYPYSRAVSLRACMTYVALFLISFFVGGGNVSAFSLFMFAICAAILLNQSSIDRERMSLSLTELPLSVRIGGMRSVLWLGTVFLVVLAVMTVIVGGGMMLGRVLLFMLLRQREDVEADSFGEYGSSEDVLDNLDRYLVREGEMGSVNMLLMVLFIVGAVLVLLWFAFRRNEAIRLWLHQLAQRIADFFEWLFGTSTRLYYRANRDGDEVSYRDAYKKLRPTGYDTARRAEVGELSWREFRSQLAACADDSAKLTYAYRILVVRLRAQPHFPLLRSDTPRSIDRKVRARGRHEELREITAVYEAINYAECLPETERVARALETTCRILQEYLN